MFSFHKIVISLLEKLQIWTISVQRLARFKTTYIQLHTSCYFYIGINIFRKRSWSDLARPWNNPSLRMKRKPHNWRIKRPSSNKSSLHSRHLTRIQMINGTNLLLRIKSWKHWKLNLPRRRQKLRPGKKILRRKQLILQLCRRRLKVPGMKSPTSPRSYWIKLRRSTSSANNLTKLIMSWIVLLMIWPLRKLSLLLKLRSWRRLRMSWPHWRNSWQVLMKKTGLQIISCI